MYNESINVDKGINLTGEDRETTIIDGGGFPPIMMNSDWINLTGFTLTEGGPTPGIDIQTSNIRIIGNIIKKSSQGIWCGPSNINISNNIITETTTGSGIWAIGPIDNVVISYNEIFSNAGMGINLMAGSDNVKIIGNLISYNTEGILCGSGTNNLITNNTLWNNWRGIMLAGSSNNQIYHNNIIGNTIQAGDDSNNGNQWDNGYPSGGNYWSDYTGVDFNSTPTQDVPPPDEIGDTPYFIDSNSKDNYPSMVPFGNFTMLSEGWNLISLPLIQPETNLDSVLSFMDAKYDAVQWYDNIDSSDLWKHNHISKISKLNDLKDLNHTQGFWVNIINPGGAIFCFLGSQPRVNQTITLYPGWNMVGYPSLSNHNRTVGLNNLSFDKHVDAIHWYDAFTQTWHFMGPDDSFVPGRGYWMHSKVEAGWEVPL
jgi:parallel beta-helix repeat protein